MSGPTPSIPLAAEDRAILDLESPTVVGHTCKVIELAPDGATVDAIRTRLASRLSDASLLTRCLSNSGPAPCWIQDPLFDITQHVVAAPPGPPLDIEDVRSLVGQLFTQRLPRDRPLWRIDVAPLANGGTVLIWRIHHALADGITIIRLAEILLWDGHLRHSAARSAISTPGTGGLEQDQNRRRLHLASFLRREFAESGPSPFDGTIGTRREVGFTTVSLPQLRHAAHELAGATVNDALLSAVAGALRSWIEWHHGTIGDVRVRVPVSLHGSGEDSANRDSFFNVILPLHIADPIERLRAVRAQTAIRKAEHDAELEGALMQALRIASPSLQKFATRLQDHPRRFAVSVSNVPGPREPVTVLGAQVRSLASVVEIGNRHALRVAAMSLSDQLSLGFCADPSLVPDVQIMAGAAHTEVERIVTEASG